MAFLVMEISTVCRRFRLRERSSGESDWLQRKIGVLGSTFGGILEGILTLHAKLVQFSTDAIKNRLWKAHVILDCETTKLDSSVQLLLLGFSPDYPDFIALLVRMGPNNPFERIGLLFVTHWKSFDHGWETTYKQTVVLR
jgi:hypothetical protein